MNRYQEHQDRTRTENSLMLDSSLGGFGGGNAMVSANDARLAAVYNKVEEMFYAAGEVNSLNDITTSTVKHAMENCVDLAMTEASALQRAPLGREEYRKLSQFHTLLLARAIERRLS